MPTFIIGPTNKIEVTVGELTVTSSIEVLGGGKFVVAAFMRSALSADLAYFDVKDGANWRRIGFIEGSASNKDPQRILREEVYSDEGVRIDYTRSAGTVDYSITRVMAAPAP